MDVDYDIDSNPIQDFLLHKLDAAKKRNAEIKSAAADISNLLKRLQTEQKNASASIVCIEESWKKIFNGKYVLGFHLNSTSDGNLCNVKVTFRLASTIPSYTTQIFTTSSLQLVKEFNGTGVVVVVLEAPQFLKQNTMELHGAIDYTYGKLDGQVKLPVIELKASDFTAHFDVKLLDVIKGDLKSLLSLKCGLQCVALAMNRQNTSLETYLAIDCMFREVQCDDDKYFVIYDISDSIDGGLIEIKQRHDEFYLINLYYRNKTHLHYILHYLHQKIQAVRILPEEFKLDVRQPEECDLSSQRYLSQKPEAADPDVKEFGMKLLQQSEALSSFLSKKNDLDKTTLTKEYQKFRCRLSDLERETDLLYAKLSFDH